MKLGNDCIWRETMKRTGREYGISSYIVSAYAKFEGGGYREYLKCRPDRQITYASFYMCKKAAVQRAILEFG